MNDYFWNTIALSYSQIARLNATPIAFKIAIGKFKNKNEISHIENAKCHDWQIIGVFNSKTSLKIAICVKIGKLSVFFFVRILH